jgi:hypothetical protein
MNPGTDGEFAGSVNDEIELVILAALPITRSVLMQSLASPRRNQISSQKDVSGESLLPEVTTNCQRALTAIKARDSPGFRLL